MPENGKFSNRREDSLPAGVHQVCIQERFLGKMDSSLEFIQKTVGENQQTVKENKTSQDEHNKNFYANFKELNTSMNTIASSQQSLPEDIFKKMQKKRSDKFKYYISVAKVAGIVITVGGALIGVVSYISKVANAIGTIIP